MACLCGSPTRTTAVSSWVQDGQLLEECLKAKIGLCTKKLSTEGDEGQWGEGAELLHSTMMDIWGLETGELSRGAADLACDEIR